MMDWYDGGRWRLLGTGVESESLEEQVDLWRGCCFDFMPHCVAHLCLVDGPLRLAVHRISSVRKVCAAPAECRARLGCAAPRLSPASAPSRYLVSRS